jgi:hypothetical protein
MKHLHFIILLLITILTVRSVSAQAVDMLVTSPGLKIVPGSSSQTVSLEFALLTELGDHLLSSDEKAPNFARVRIKLSNLDGANILPSGTGGKLFSWSYVPAEKAYIGRSKDLMLAEDEHYLVQLTGLPVHNTDQSGKIGFSAVLLPPQDFLNSETQDDSLHFFLPSPLEAQFTAERQNNTAVLNAQLSPQAKTGRLEVERSTDGKGWSKIGEIDMTIATDITKPLDFKDMQPKTGQNLYRLKMTDQHGQAKYSIGRRVTFGQNEREILYPNPVKGDEKLNLLNSEIDQITRIRIFDVTGKEVYHAKATSQIDTSSFVPGSYLVQLTYTDGSTSTHRVVKL